MQTLIAAGIWVLVAIVGFQAIPSTSTNSTPPQTAAAEEEIVKVIGRYVHVFDGLGASGGFLVEGSRGLEAIKYDPGSMAGQSEWTPEYLMILRLPNGRSEVQPVELLVTEHF